MIGKVLCCQLALIILGLLDGISSNNNDGVLISKKSKRIIIGKEIGDISEKPFAAQLKYASNNTFACGGTLISIMHVLTAAHCILEDISSYGKPKNYKIVVGAKWITGVGGTGYLVEKFFLPHTFDVQTTQSDILIIKLLSKVQLRPGRVAPAKLPFRREKYNVKAQIAGWGRNERGALSQTLKALSAVNMEANKCQLTYGCDYSGRDDSMCVSPNPTVGKAASGDSGSGLVKNNVVIGVYSNGGDNDCETKLDEYTVVWPHVEWILSVMSDEIIGNTCVVEN